MTDHVRPDIPLDWSAEQAAAVFEFLQTLQEQLWMLYGADIQRFHRARQQAPEIPPHDESSPPF